MSIKEENHSNISLLIITPLGVIDSSYKDFWYGNIGENNLLLSYASANAHIIYNSVWNLPCTNSWLYAFYSGFCLDFFLNAGQFERQLQCLKDKFSMAIAHWNVHNYSAVQESGKRTAWRAG